MTIVWIVIGVLCGVLLAWLWQRQQNFRGSLLASQMEGRIKEIAQEALKQNHETFFELAKSRLSEESLQQRGQMDLAKKEVEGLLKPLQETLQNYKKELSDVEAQRNKDYGTLGQLLKSMSLSHEQLRTETTQLVHALKRPTVRGRWGEVQLRRIVELAGMSSYCDFTEQTVHLDDHDVRMRPDMLIKLPNSRQIVIDAKAPMDAYLDAEAADNEPSRKSALLRHAQAVRSRITELSRKSYWDQFENSPEFVVLFIPGEAFFSAALEADPTLVEAGFEQKVILATPTTLMSLLKAVAYGWRQEQLAENAKRISEQAGRIQQALAIWTSHMDNVGRNLERSVKAYNESMGSFERNVMPSLRKMGELGVASKTPLTEPSIIEAIPRETQIKVKVSDTETSTESIDETK